jgi:nicotinamide-nucleotide amidase
MSDLEPLARRFLSACEKRGILAATAESCTGGLIIGALTDVAGSSSVVDRGFITYSNDAKMDMLGVSAETLEAFGAVSRETALAMAAGALARSRASIALAVSGVAGPGGGSVEKPVGLVWLGVAVAGQNVVAVKRVFDDRGRAFIRHETVRAALELGLAALGDQEPAGAS